MSLRGVPDEAIPKLNSQTSFTKSWFWFNIRKSRKRPKPQKDPHVAERSPPHLPLPDHSVQSGMYPEAGRGRPPPHLAGRPAWERLGHRIRGDSSPEVRGHHPRKDAPPPRGADALHPG